MGYSEKIFKYISKYDLLCLFIFVLIIYNLNFRSIGAGDTVPASLMPFMILDNHSLFFNQFVDYYQTIGTVTYFFTNINGNYLSTYPIVTPVLITPLYIVPYLFLKLIHCPIDIFNPTFRLVFMIMEKLSASIITSLSAIFVYLSIKEITNKKIGIVCLIVYAFATDTWAISSQGLWQHGMSELLLSMLIYLVIKNEAKNDSKNFIYMGILSGLSIFNRPSDSIMLIPIFAYVLLNKYKAILRFTLPMILTCMPFIAYNYYYFKNITGGYGSAASLLVFNYHFAVNYLGLLISPSRGILIYSPVILLSIFGFFYIKNIDSINMRIFLYISGLAIVAQIFIYSIFQVWWAGWSYGPRYLICILPFLIIYIALLLPKKITLGVISKREQLILGVLILLLIPSIFSQIIGTFYYPNGYWDANPNIDLHPEQLWNWSDTQMMRSFNSGLYKPNLTPIVNFLKGS